MSDIERFEEFAKMVRKFDPKVLDFIDWPKLYEEKRKLEERA